MTIPRPAPFTVPSAASPSTGEPTWLQPLLTVWQMSDPLPPNVADHLPPAMAAAEQALQPIAPKALAVLLDHLFTTLPAPDRDGLRLWRHMLSPYPEAVLARAVREVIATHRWETVPKIAQVLDACKEDLARLHGWKRKLDSAALKLRMEQRAARPCLPCGGGAPTAPTKALQTLHDAQQTLRRRGQRAFSLPTEV